MRIDEIKSYDGRGPQDENIQSDPEKLARTLFVAAAKGFEIPTLDDIMTCDVQTIADATETRKGDSVHMMFSLGSTPECGFVEIRNGHGFVLTASWKDGKASEVRVTNPRMSCVQVLKREDIRRMRLRVDGQYYKGYSMVQMFIESIFPER